jgi:hypothetical protein
VIVRSEHNVESSAAAFELRTCLCSLAWSGWKTITRTTAKKTGFRNGVAMRKQNHKVTALSARRKRIVARLGWFISLAAMSVAGQQHADHGSQPKSDAERDAERAERMLFDLVFGVACVTVFRLLPRSSV